MKKVVALLLALMLVLGGVAVADVDLSGMSLDELIALQNQITLAMWATDEWQEVRVPAGLYKIGESIPAGRWTIKIASPNEAVYITYGKHANKTMTDILSDYDDEYQLEIIQSLYESNFSPSQITFVLADGYYLQLTGDTIFTPFIPNSLGFK